MHFDIFGKGWGNFTSLKPEAGSSYEAICPKQRLYGT